MWKTTSKYICTGYLFLRIMYESTPTVSGYIFILCIVYSDPEYRVSKFWIFEWIFIRSYQIQKSSKSQSPFTASSCCRRLGMIYIGYVYVYTKYQVHSSSRRLKVLKLKYTDSNNRTRRDIYHIQLEASLTIPSLLYPPCPPQLLKKKTGQRAKLFRRDL